MGRRGQMLGIVAIAISVWGALVYSYFRAARQTIWAEIREHLTSIAQAIALSTVLEKERRLRQTAWLVFAILSNLTFIVTLLFKRLCAALQSLREKADALAQAKADWDLTFDLIGTGIAILDGNFTVLQVNEALAKLIGKSEGELVGKRCNEVLHPELTYAKTCPYEAAIRRGEMVSQEVQLPDGRIFFIQAKWLSYFMKT